MEYLNNKEIAIKTSVDGELVVTSRQVAEDFGKNHKEVLRGIDTYKNRISSTHFCALFIESEYRASNGKMNKEYLLTRDGFSFLVMGFTGAKADEWKLKYIDAFNRMEQALRKPVKQLSPMEMMKLQYEVLQQHEAKIVDVENKVENLKDNMPLFNVDCKEVQALVKQVGIKTLGGYRSKAYNNKSLRSKVYIDIHQQIRREFGVNRYEAIKRCQLEKAMGIVSRYKAPVVLEDEIILINSQVCFGEDNEQ